MWRLILTKRSPALADHAGQISFPGGRVDAGESAEAAARRELREELGVNETQVLVLGRLTDVYVFASDFNVRPFVATVQSSVTFQPNETEVAQVLEIPLDEIQPECSRLEWRRIRRGGLEFKAPHVVWRDHRIWGATATILGELVAVLRDI